MLMYAKLFRLKYLNSGPSLTLLCSPVGNVALCANVELPQGTVARSHCFVRAQNFTDGI